MHPSNLLHSRRGRFIAFGTLYISEGIPYGFSSTAMVMFMRMEGLSLEQIGAFAAAQLLPWGFKWAWAPLIDIVKLNRFGGRKAWIVLCTTMMIVTLIGLALVDFETHYEVLIWAVLLNNLFCATQDVAIDSLAVSTLKEDERGTGNGFMFGGQYLGIALGGGGAIFVSSMFGFNASLFFISSLLALTLLFAIVFIKDPDAEAPAAAKQARPVAHFVATVKDFVVDVYKSFWRSGRGPMVGVLFALLPTGAMALGYAILGTLQVDYGLPQASIAQISVMNTIAGGIGCLIGGTLGDRFGIKRMTATFYLMTTLPTVYLATKIATVGLAGISVGELYSAIVVHGLLFGAAFALKSAIFMGLTNPVVAATQFTGYMAMGNLAISMGNFWQGMVAERLGYAVVLYLDALVVVIALCALPWLRNRDPIPELAVGEPVVEFTGSESK